jgi:hypothetical protein
MYNGRYRYGYASCGGALGRICTLAEVGCLAEVRLFSDREVEGAMAGVGGQGVILR